MVIGLTPSFLCGPNRCIVNRHSAPLECSGIVFHAMQFVNGESDTTYAILAASYRRPAAL